jgi:L-aminopeptidase/D-esterase-like protein
LFASWSRRASSAASEKKRAMTPERDDAALTPLQRALAAAIASAIVRRLRQEEALTAPDGSGIERPSQTHAERRWPAPVEPRSRHGLL